MLRKKRLSRLEDHRTYSAALRTEVLLTAGLLDVALAEQIHAARAQRNDLMHKSQATERAAREGMDALVRVLEIVLGHPVAQPQFASNQTFW